MKFGKVLTYKDVEEAKKLIGKKVLVASSYKGINEAKPDDTGLIIKLKDVRDNESFPFDCDSYGCWEFIREVIEEDKPKRMTNSQLAEWLVKGNGQGKYRNQLLVFSHHHYYEYQADLYVSENIFIKPWGSNKWIVPTVEIFERDCRGEK